MKKYILLILLSAFHTQAIAQKNNQFVLHGNIKGAANGLVMLYYSNQENKRVQDSAKITGGKFLFKGNIYGPVMAYISLKEERRNEANSVGIFLEPNNMEIELEINKFGEAKINGSETGKEYASLQTKKAKVAERWRVVMDTLSAANKRSNVEYQELKDWVLIPYFAEMEDMDLQFFKEYPQSPVTAYTMRFYVSKLTIDSLQMYYNGLGKTTQQSIDGVDLANEIKKLQSGSPGAIAANFSAMDIKGKQLNLSDFKGSYVLLDFWASWCVPCRKGNPHLKELYAKYKSKGIEFIGVSDDDTKPDAWHKAVEKDQLPWRHVMRGFDREKRMNNLPNENDISEKFGIHSLPTKILIDKQGKIIGRYSEEEGSLDEKLKEIFGS